MQRFKLEIFSADIVSHAGSEMIGQAIKKQIRLRLQQDTRVPLRYGINHSDILKRTMFNDKNSIVENHVSAAFQE